MTPQELKESILFDYQQETHDYVRVKIAKFSKENALQYYKDKDCSSWDNPNEKEEVLAILKQEHSFLFLDNKENSFDDAICEIANKFEQIAPNLLKLLFAQDETAYNFDAKDILTILAEIDANSKEIMDNLECCVSWYFSRGYWDKKKNGGKNA